MNAEVVQTKVKDDDICGTIVRAVAVASDKAPESLTPLYNSLDPDALEALFAPSLKAGRAFDGHVEFSYEGYRVSVYSDGEILVKEIDESNQS